MKNKIPVKITNWLEQICLQYSKIEILAGDASLRCYFRIHCDHQTYVLMDTSNEIHYLKPFIQYAHLLERHHISVPHIYEVDLKNGLVLLSDLGDQLFLHRLNTHDPHHAYKTAMDTLLDLQSYHLHLKHDLPLYDKHTYQKEIELFRSWYVPYYLQKSLTPKTEKTITDAFDLIIEHILTHPHVFVHRDYHSRNLIWLNNKQLAMVDFQDACLGSVAYDIASLIKDCYIKWPFEQQQQWLTYFYHQLTEKNIIEVVDFPTFSRWVDWVGLQRHLKCLGIFVRLKKQKNQCYHIQHIPIILDYIRPVINKYPEFQELNHSLKTLHKDIS